MINFDEHLTFNPSPFASAITYFIFYLLWQWIKNMKVNFAFFYHETCWNKEGNGVCGLQIENKIGPYLWALNCKNLVINAYVTFVIFYNRVEKPVSLNGNCSSDIKEWRWWTDDTHYLLMLTPQSIYTPNFRQMNLSLNTEITHLFYHLIELLKKVQCNT